MHLHSFDKECSSTIMITQTSRVRRAVSVASDSMLEQVQCSLLIQNANTLLNYQTK